MRAATSQQASTHIKVECASHRNDYSTRTFELENPPLIGRDRPSLKHVPAIFNVGLGVQGDARLAAASASDLAARSSWFRNLVLTKLETKGQGSLLEMVTVPCAVPFEVLEAAIDGIYSGRIQLTWGPGAGNLLHMTLLADALQLTESCELLSLCTRTALESLPTGDEGWSRRVHTMALQLSDDTLARDTLASMASRALCWQHFLAPVASALGLVKAESPAIQLASIFDRLRTRAREGVYLRWPTSFVVLLLMRIDQLEQDDGDDYGKPDPKRLRTDTACTLFASRPAAPWLDAAALLSEIDFGGLRGDEWRALALQASTCSKQTPALTVFTQRLLQRSIGAAPAAQPLYTPAAASTFVTVTVTLATDPARTPTLENRNKENKLFIGNGKEEWHAASLSVTYDALGKMLSLVLSPAATPDSCLRDAGITGFTYYGLSCTLKAGFSVLGVLAPMHPKDVAKKAACLIARFKDETLRRHADAKGKVMLGVRVF